MGGITAFPDSKGVLTAAAEAYTPLPAPGNMCTGGSTQLPAAQCSAWIDLYESTNGPGWEYCSGTKTNPCACYGSPYGGRAVGTTPVCNTDNTTVVSLRLSWNHMLGTLPDSIGAFVDTQLFGLWNNALSGTLPSSMGAMTKMEELYINYNEFSGAIPASMSAWTALKIFWVAGNAFTAFPPDLRAAWAQRGVTFETFGNYLCDGSSLALEQTQCVAWVLFYDATGGAHWTRHSSARTDPCSCSFCNAANTTVVSM
jgi:hypothetical protein